VPASSDDRDGGRIPPEVVDYVAAADPENRALLERVQRLILEACPHATIAFAYKMPAYEVGKRRLSVGAWAHGISIYGWQASGDGGLTERHPELRSGRGTIRLRTDQAAEIGDEEIRALARTVLGS
jgi:uncharacterized protein YdhG (YjbR/CyaY superfamily)